MNIRKWLILAVTLTLALATAGSVTAFALNGDGGDHPTDGTNTAGEVTLHGDPTYEEWLSKYQPIQGPVTSIDDIDPKVCNLVHNLNACTPEELEEVGNLAAISWIVDLGTAVEGNSEPLSVDGEPRFQSLEEAVEQDCGLAGGAVYVTSGGELGCVVAHIIEDNGEELVSSSQPPTIEPLPAPVTQ